MNYPRPILVVSNGVRLDLRDMSQVERDNRDTLDLEAIKERLRQDSGFAAEILAVVRALAPSRFDYLDNAPPLPASPSSASVPSGESDSLIVSLLENLTPHRDLVLFWVTITCPGDPRTHLAQLLASTVGAWGVLEARHDRSLHAHMLVLLSSRLAADALLKRWCSLSGGKSNGQNAQQVKGWSAFAVRRDLASLAQNLSRIVAYTGKQVFDSFAVGALADVPMLSRPGDISLTVTTALCPCGCKQTTGPRSKYAAPACGVRHRQRELRARRKAVTVARDTPATVTEGTESPSPPVTAERDTAPTVTGENADAWLDERVGAP